MDGPASSSDEIKSSYTFPDTGGLGLSDALALLARDRAPTTVGAEPQGKLEAREVVVLGGVVAESRTTFIIAKLKQLIPVFAWYGEAPVLSPEP